MCNAHAEVARIAGASILSRILEEFGDLRDVGGRRVSAVDLHSIGMVVIHHEYLPGNTRR
jgi:hypothetical protein